MSRLANLIETIAYSSRWLVAPFLLGLIFGLAMLLFKFIVKLADFVIQVRGNETSEAIVGILNLVDLTLTANLIVIVICSSCENFVSPIDYTKHTNWPPGLIKIGFSGLKQKLLGYWSIQPEKARPGGGLSATSLAPASASGAQREWAFGRGRSNRGWPTPAIRKPLSAFAA
jgi:Uncharacterized protein family, UPF0114